MAKNVPAKIEFLSAEIEGLRARMSNYENSAQRLKLEMLTDIRGDYQTAAGRAVSQKRGNEELRAAQ